MPRELLPMSDRFKYLSRHKRTFIYALILMIVAVGHYYLMQISLESFRYIRQSVISMLCMLCLNGVFVLVAKQNGVRSRSRSLFTFVMFMVGLTNLLSLINGLTAGRASVVSYEFMSFPMLIYGSIYAYIFLLYPIEAFRPGWLTMKRALLLLLPTIALLVLHFLFVKILNVPVPVITSSSALLHSLWNIHVLMGLLILAYPVFGLVIMLRYRKNYKEWCENNYASMENMDVKWLEDYIFGNLVITFSCEILVLSNDIRSSLMHNIIFLFFFLYAFNRVLFQKSPYPEGYFKAGLDETKVEAEEEMVLDVSSNIQCMFTNKLPEYKGKLEQWMQTEKPYLRKDFKLTDVMGILPLNRSYLSRVFNEGYGESFYQYVMRYRIAESKGLLLSRPDLNITSVADLSGFSSLSVFGRAFAQEMSCSPTQWREKRMHINV